MSTDSWSPYILTFVTFAPLAGALLLVLFPRRDRDIRIFALVVSLFTFFPIAAPARSLSSLATGISIRS
jgi:NADH:ubiquinone oxidoreductase subunit 4 (subunit M)